MVSSDSNVIILCSSLISYSFFLELILVIMLLTYHSLSTMFDNILICPLCLPFHCRMRCSRLCCKCLPFQECFLMYKTTHLNNFLIPVGSPCFWEYSYVWKGNHLVLGNCSYPIFWCNMGKVCGLHFLFLFFEV